MKHTVILSFDLLRNEEESISLSVASLLSYLKNDSEYNKKFTIQHISFNMWENNDLNKLYDDISTLPLKEIDTIAISCYIWNEYLINPLIDKLRTLGFLGKIVLGGYQISYSNPKKVQDEYPQANIFIFGNGEQSLLKSILLKKTISPIFLNEPVNFSKIPSVYLTGEVPIRHSQAMVRWETKRGCPYRCSFCAHRDLVKNKVYRHELDKIFAELSFFNKNNIGRINILDPVFNSGNTYLEILKEAARINLTSTVTMQTRFELIQGEKGKNFLSLCKKINAYLEFGLQTAIVKESNIINRQNKIEIVGEVLKKLRADNIPYEVSLIYGLPEQTVSSFKQSIDFLRSYGCENIVAYPLMLLKGTELYSQKSTYNFVEEQNGEFHIPTVVSSNSFTKDNWLEMKSIAQKLSVSNRRV